MKPANDPLVSDQRPVASRWPQFPDDEIEAVTRVLRSGRVNRWTGEECNSFEQEFAAYCGTRYAISLANGTVALELPFRVLGIGTGDEVITTPRSFFATASAIELSGARAVFADVDPDSQNICANSIRAKITPRTKAVVVVHLAGWPADMDPIMALAREHGLSVIEDCAQAHGARYKGRPVGGIGDFGAFSFCQDKIMTTGGEGGMLVLNDEPRWKRAWSFKEHGKDFDKAHGAHSGQGFRWMHDSFGSNWRLTEMQAAIGRVQLQKLDRWVEHRRANAAYLSTRFAEMPALRVTQPAAETFHSYYKYYVFSREADRRDAIQSALVARGIPTFVGACPEIYRERAFLGSVASQTRLPVAERLGRESLLFQVDITLSLDDMERIADTMESVLAEMR